MRKTKRKKVRTEALPMLLESKNWVTMKRATWMLCSMTQQVGEGLPSHRQSLLKSNLLLGRK